MVVLSSCILPISFTQNILEPMDPFLPHSAMGGGNFVDSIWVIYLKNHASGVEFSYLNFVTLNYQEQDNMMY